jgi:TATA-box binding protein (TBP) (component of TFIID and TFIIIB)
MIQDNATPHDSILLQVIADSLPCCKYARSKFAAMTIRISNPKCTALLFTTGKLVVTGGNNWYECMLTAMHIATLISQVSQAYL